MSQQQICRFPDILYNREDILYQSRYGINWVNGRGEIIYYTNHIMVLSRFGCMYTHTHTHSNNWPHYQTNNIRVPSKLERRCMHAVNIDPTNKPIILPYSKDADVNTNPRPCPLSIPCLCPHLQTWIHARMHAVTMDPESKSLQPNFVMARTCYKSW